jgi:hypothetical protein
MLITIERTNDTKRTKMDHQKKQELQTINKRFVCDERHKIIAKISPWDSEADRVDACQL